MQWLQRNYLNELEYDARYATDKGMSFTGTGIGANTGTAMAMIKCNIGSKKLTFKFINYRVNRHNCIILAPYAHVFMDIKGKKCKISVAVF